jgi:type VI secretion system secreted protein Hcp
MSQQDIFLSLVTARGGPLKGESSDPGHLGEIDIIEWTWGMKVPTEAGSLLPTGRAQVFPVRFVKRADSSSTGLMSALRQNDLVKKAVLTMRKSGGVKPVDYFVVTLEKGRLLSYEVASQRDERGVPSLIETVSLGFLEITVDYTGQDPKGGKTASSTYSDQISTAV